MAAALPQALAKIEAAKKAKEEEEKNSFTGKAKSMVKSLDEEVGSAMNKAGKAVDDALDDISDFFGNLFD